MTTLTAIGSIAHGTTSYVLVKFTDKDGEPSAPSAGKYTVVNPATGEKLVDNVNLPALAVEVEIAISADVNKLADLPGKAMVKEERRRVLVAAEFGAGNEKLQGFCEYKIIAVSGMTA